MSKQRPITAGSRGLRWRNNKGDTGTGRCIATYPSRTGTIYVIEDSLTKRELRLRGAQVSRL